MARKKRLKSLPEALELGCLMNAREVAQALNVSEPQVYRLIHEYRALTYVEVGKQMRFRPRDIEAFINCNVKEVA